MIIFGVEVKGDHTFDRESMERYMFQAYRAGREDERATIVEWLIEQGFIDTAANAIEAGEHLK